MNIEVNHENLGFFQALASDTRLKIIEILKHSPENIKDMAEKLEISQAMTTRHIQMLVKAGVVGFEKKAASRGRQKLCYIKEKDFNIIIPDAQTESGEIAADIGDMGVIKCEIPIGSYIDYDIEVTCGLASPRKIIGMLDDTRYFADPAHINASLLWFGQGWITYKMPNYALASQRIERLEISLEICSEAPGYNESWPSDIFFEINGINLGKWICPGDFGSRPGALTPEWYNMGTQYGLLKTIKVDEAGSYVDGSRISDITIDDLDLASGVPIEFSVINPKDAQNRGGVTLFGKSFGNYSQDIVLSMWTQER